MNWASAVGRFVIIVSPSKNASVVRKMVTVLCVYATGRDDDDGSCRLRFVRLEFAIVVIVEIAVPVPVPVDVSDSASAAADLDENQIDSIGLD